MQNPVRCYSDKRLLESLAILDLEVAASRWLLQQDTSDARDMHYRRNRLIAAKVTRSLIKGTIRNGRHKQGSRR